eukprot:gb/GFBE01040173.1/.p1 GENE.gb/GFBE01040173.1/~~gb/GFBE01040173.1/.p1  ORF type:complete len:1119 (+),score=434.13 gb/GFBE01040173.1/:1-3357(+)
MAELAQLVEMLQALTNSDNTVRQKAETMYQTAKAGNPDQLLQGMLGVMGSAQVEENIRRHCGVLFRQLCTRGPEKDFVFARAQPNTKLQVAGALLQLFEAEANPKLQKNIGSVVTKLAEYVCDEDDPRGSLQPGTDGWPNLLQTIFRLANVQSATSVTSCENALTVLKDLVPNMKTHIRNHQAPLGAVIQNGLGSPEVKHKIATLLLICDMVTEMEKKDWAQLTGTVNSLVQVLYALAQAKMEEELSTCIQAFVEVATTEPDFFKGTLQSNKEPAVFMATVVRSKEVQDGGVRGLALEWMVSFLEKRAKWLKKNMPDFVAMTLEACMNLLLEVEDGEAELKAWIERMDDEEGDEDEDELFHTGEECIDRVAEAYEMENLAQDLFKLVGHFVAQDSWQAKHAALAAVKQTVEYVEDKNHVKEMAKLLQGHVDHPHPRVRYTALHGLGQLANDQSPHFQEESHKEVMPLLRHKMGDQVDKVAAMSMSAFVSFGEELDTSLMAAYSKEFMEALVQKLTSSRHRGVREECITSIAVIAGVIEKDFSAYYDNIMPLLKQFIMQATGEKETRLRGKAFECMSLLGIAVGKEKFLPDAKEAIQAMMNTKVEADDIQREYIKEASERICVCLKKDFAQFLPALLPNIFKNLQLDQLHNQAPTSADGGDDEDNYVQVTTGDGKLVNVHTGKFEEMMQSVQMLHTFCTEMESGYFDAIPQTAQVLLPLLSATDEMSMLCDEVRGTALRVWALLINAARLGAQERGQPMTIASELLKNGLQAATQQIAKSEDPEMLCELVSAMSECIKNVGPGVLGDAEVQQLTQQTFEWIDQSLKRSVELDKDKNKAKQEASSLGQGLGDDEDEDADPGADEDQLRKNFEEVLGAMMKVAPEKFVGLLQGVAQKIQLWVQNEQTKVLGLYLACDVIEHLKEASEPAWPAFMPMLFKSASDPNAEARTAAAYAFNLAAPLPKFAEAVPEAFRAMAKIVSGPKPKKKEEKEKITMDNAVAALLSLAKEKGNLCPPEVQAWDLVLGKLPIKDDEEEAKKVHEKLICLVLEQNQGLLGQDNKNLGRVLSILAEIYKNEDICAKESQDKILQIFKMLPQQVLMGAASHFTEKQQKKIEKMLSA